MSRAPRLVVLGLMAAPLLLMAALARGQGSGAKTLGPASCAGGNCHKEANQWAPGDDHYKTYRPFERDPAYLKMLQRMGIDPSDYAAINSRCMTCHGTVVSGKEATPVEYGVSCESCHGVGERYLKVHQENVPGSYTLGLLNMKNTTVRAKQCTGCHYIFDEKLAKAGHGFGWDLDKVGKYTRGIEDKISKHWKKHVLNGEDLETQPYLTAINNKGYPPPAPAGAPAAGEGGGGQVVYRTETVYVGRELSPLFFPEDTVPLTFSPLTLPPDSTSVAVLLRVLQDRLKVVYTALDSAVGGSDD